MPEKVFSVNNANYRVDYDFEGIIAIYKRDDDNPDDDWQLMPLDWANDALYSFTKSLEFLLSEWKKAEKKRG